MKVLTQQLLGLFPPFLCPSSIISSSLAAALGAKANERTTRRSTLPIIAYAIIVRNYKPQGAVIFSADTPDVEAMIKECKCEGHPRPIGPVFHALIHIKASQARLLKALGV